MSGVIIIAVIFIASLVVSPGLVSEDDQMDGKGNYTKEALDQQDLLKDALTDYSIRTNVPVNDLLEGQMDVVTKRTGGKTIAQIEAEKTGAVQCRNFQLRL